MVDYLKFCLGGVGHLPPFGLQVCLEQMITEEDLVLSNLCGRSGGGGSDSSDLSEGFRSITSLPVASEDNERSSTSMVSAYFHLHKSILILEIKSSSSLVMLNHPGYLTWSVLYVVSILALIVTWKGQLKYKISAPVIGGKGGFSEISFRSPQRG